MIKLFGTDYSKEDLLARVGDISQVGGVRLAVLDDGRGRGVRTAEFRTGSGLDFTVLLDRGMDISTADFNGRALSWRSAVGDASPAYFEEPGLGWLRNFPGGLVTTCGLTSAGAPCVDQGTSLGLHGRISNTPASNVYADSEWQGDSYVMWVQGRVRQTALFGENVEMVRTISTKLGEPKIWLHDKITNHGFSDIEHMLLYHCNLGFPVIDAGSRLIASVKECKPRDAVAQKGSSAYRDFTRPIKDDGEQVFYLDLNEDKKGNVNVAVVNEAFNEGQGFGVCISYPKKELPKLAEWKMMCEGVYVVGIEPANCWVEGRAKERERGTLQFLKPGETREYHLEFSILPSKDAIDKFERVLQGAVG